MIRNWNANDIEKLCQIEKATFDEYWTAGNYLDSLENKNFNVLIYESDGEIVAYLSYCLTNFEIDIANLTTVKNLRRQGIARKLILHLIEIAKERKAEKINLEVKVSNHSAISFYQNIGFSIVGTRKRFYSDTEDGYTMSLFLEEIL